MKWKRLFLKLSKYQVEKYCEKRQSPLYRQRIVTSRLLLLVLPPRIMAIRSIGMGESVGKHWCRWFHFVTSWMASHTMSWQAELCRFRFPHKRTIGWYRLPSHVRHVFELGGRMACSVRPNRCRSKARKTVIPFVSPPWLAWCVAFICRFS